MMYYVQKAHIKLMFRLTYYWHQLKFQNDHMIIFLIQFFFVFLQGGGIHGLFNKRLILGFQPSHQI